MVALKNNAMNVLALGAMAAVASAEPGIFDGLLGGSTSSSSSTPGTLTRNGCYYSVPNVGLFTTKYSQSWDNALSLATVGLGVVEDLVASIYTVSAGNSPLPRRFDLINIGYSLTDPSMTLTVPGGQTKGPISSAQITTAYSDILFGSVRTVAKVSSIPGTTHGFSFYSNDTQEIDFAFLTSDNSVAHLTNEQVSANSPSTSFQVKAPADATSAFHEYRVDWIPGKAQFYIDNVLVQTITGNVPTTPGFWLWNNWSNGNAWAAGPPLKDNILKIKSIDAYFNRTTVIDTYRKTKLLCQA